MFYVIIVLFLGIIVLILHCVCIVRSVENLVIYVDLILLMKFDTVSSILVKGHR